MINKLRDVRPSNIFVFTMGCSLMTGLPGLFEKWRRRRVAVPSDDLNPRKALTRKLPGWTGMVVSAFVRTENKEICHGIKNCGRIY